MKCEDIRLLSKEKKYEAYNKIGREAKGVRVKEHESGFPAITIDYKNLHFLTDCLSVEEWWKEQKCERRKNQCS